MTGEHAGAFISLLAPLPWIVVVSREKMLGRRRMSEIALPRLAPLHRQIGAIPRVIAPVIGGRYAGSSTRQSARAET